MIKFVHSLLNENENITESESKRHSTGMKTSLNCCCLQNSENGSVEGSQNIVQTGQDKMEDDFLLSGTFSDVIFVMRCGSVENRMNWPEPVHFPKAARSLPKVSSVCHPDRL
jgi:hypothetical protein